MSEFTFTDLKKINRKKLGTQVPLELFRAVRLIGMYQGLPMHGKGTTVTIGKKIGENLPVSSVQDILRMFIQLKIGFPLIMSEDSKGFRVKVDDCFCEGLPIENGKMVCDLEGAILEGALNKVLNRKVSVQEVKCNVNGDEHCEYMVRYL